MVRRMISDFCQNGQRWTLQRIPFVSEPDGDAPTVATQGGPLDEALGR